MAIVSTHNPWIFTFGILGNLVSIVVFLAPVPTFLRVYRKKSTEGFQSLPYLVSLFSAMVWLYYASLKSDAFLLITINSAGCLVQTIYVALYIAFAPKQARILTLRIFLLMNFGGFCLIILISHFFVKGSNRVRVLGWLCVVFSVSVFAAPLSIMRLVIRTKSVEFMPFYLSFFLTLSAIMWLFYGILLRDFYIAIPNIVGFVFGVVQMVLYVIYKNLQTDPMDHKVPQDNNVVDIEKAVININMSCEMQLEEGKKDDYGGQNGAFKDEEIGVQKAHYCHEKSLEDHLQVQGIKCEA